MNAAARADRSWAGLDSLFEPSFVDYARADIVGELGSPDPDLVTRVHLLASPSPGLITVCASAQGWRFLPGGSREAGEDWAAAADRELLEEAGCRVAGEIRLFFSHRVTSHRPQPYLAHWPHPVSSSGYGICRSEVMGPPTCPPDGEQVTTVAHLPVSEAIAWLGADVTEAHHADVVRLARQLGLLES